MRHTISLMILRGTENITTFLPWYEQHIKQIVKTNQNSSWKITAWRHFRFLKQKTDLTQKNSDSKWWFCSLLLFSNNFQFCHRWSFFSIFIIKRGPGFPLSMVFLLFWFYVDFLLPKKSGWFRLVFQAQTLRTNSRYFSKIGFLAFSETVPLSSCQFQDLSAIDFFRWEFRFTTWQCIFGDLNFSYLCEAFLYTIEPHYIIWETHHKIYWIKIIVQTYLKNSFLSLEI